MEERAGGEEEDQNTTLMRKREIVTRWRLTCSPRDRSRKKRKGPRGKKKYKGKRESLLNRALRATPNAQDERYSLNTRHNLKLVVSSEVRKEKVRDAD